MKMNRIGQVSIEFMIAIAIVLMVFVLALLIISQQDAQKEFLKNSDAAIEECQYFSTAVSTVNAGGIGTEKTIELSLDANVINGFVKVQSYICKVQADANNAVLKKGTIKISKPGTKIGFSQITITP